VCECDGRAMLDGAPTVLVFGGRNEAVWRESRARIERAP